MGISTGGPEDRQDTVETLELPAEASADAFCWSLGIDGSFGWNEELPRAESLWRPVEDWVHRVVSKRSVWPSQRAAIGTPMLHGASPRAARVAARATFAAW